MFVDSTGVKYFEQDVDWENVDRRCASVTLGRA